MIVCLKVSSVRGGVEEGGFIGLQVSYKCHLLPFRPLNILKSHWFSFPHNGTHTTSCFPIIVVILSGNLTNIVSNCCIVANRWSMHSQNSHPDWTNPQIWDICSTVHSNDECCVGQDSCTGSQLRDSAHTPGWELKDMERRQFTSHGTRHQTAQHPWLSAFWGDINTQTRVCAGPLRAIISTSHDGWGLCTQNTFWSWWYTKSTGNCS